MTTKKDIAKELARSTFFNIVGWAWPLVLAFASTPFFLKGLGKDRFAILGIVAILSGYIGFINRPLAIGMVKYLAEDYGKGDLVSLKKNALNGLLVGFALSAIGGGAIYIFALPLTYKVFNISFELKNEALTCMKIAGLNFFIVGSLNSVKSLYASLSRYDYLNVINLTAATLNVGLMAAALYSGYGLIGMVLAQTLAFSFSLLIAIALLRIFKYYYGGILAIKNLSIRRAKKILSYSKFLFVGGLASALNLEIDKLAVSTLLTTSQITDYLIPSKITERLPGFIDRFTTALYPLSAETNSRGEKIFLLILYRRSIAILLWIVSSIAVLLILTSRDLLTLWVGSDIGNNSYIVLQLLAVAVIFRASGAVAYQIANGLGRADIYMKISIASVIIVPVPVYFATKVWGVIGAAGALTIAMLVLNVFYDFYVQTRVLFAKREFKIFFPYFSSIAMVLTAFACAIILENYKIQPINFLIIKIGIAISISIVLAASVGPLSFKDFRRIPKKFLSAVISN